MGILNQFDEEAIPVLLRGELGSSLQLPVYRRAPAGVAEGIDLIPETLDERCSAVLVRWVCLVQRRCVQENAPGMM